MSDEIPDVDFIVRYCSPNRVKNNIIMPSAFKIRHNEDYLSVNWIPKNLDTQIGLERIRAILQYKKFNIKADGRFVIFNIGIIKLYVHKLTGIKISICHKFSTSDSTHAGIFPIDENVTGDRQKNMYNIARALSEFTLKQPNTIYQIYNH